MILREMLMKRSKVKRSVRSKPWIAFALICTHCLLPAACVLAMPTAIRSDVGSTSPAAVRPPDIRLAPHDGFDNDDQWRDSVKTRVESMVAEAGSSADALSRGRRFLAAANLILSDAIEPSCTRRLLGIGDIGDGQLREDTSWLDRADELIAQAKGILDTVGEGSRVDEIAKARRLLAAVNAFSRAIRAYLDSYESPSSATMMREAASGLSSFLEDKDASLAAAATLWQSALLTREGSSDRVLAILDLPLSDLPRDSLPYSLHARLLRCRALVARGSFAAAYALLLQMEELTPSWMNSREQSERAMHTIALTKWQALQAWHDRLHEPQDREEREWCRTRMDEIEKEILKVDVSVVRLSPAIPRMSGD